MVTTLFNCKKLQDYCVESILEDSKSFITSKGFPLLDKDTLCGLLKRDDFLIEEVIVWDYLIKWYIKQIPDFESKDSDRTKWSNENHEVLKETLSQFIPFIRFSRNESHELFDKVSPFKVIILIIFMKNLWNFIVKSILPKNTRKGQLHVDYIFVFPLFDGKRSLRAFMAACLLASFLLLTVPVP